MPADQVRWARLGLAITLGVVAHSILLLFGLHASLRFAEICGGSLSCYWILNGIYLVLGPMLAIFFVRWAPLRIRALAAALLLTVGLVVGILATPASKP